MIAQFVKAIISIHDKNHLDFNPLQQIGIIIPFRRQIAVVRAEIAKILPCVANGIVIDTVERYQGSQRDIIIYGTTITQRYELDILSNLAETETAIIDRKLNVALTRAREQMVVVGNPSLLKYVHVFRHLIEHVQEHGCYIDAPDLK